MSKTKVLILHTSVGHGIKATALNIAEKLEASGKYETKTEDIQKIVGGGSGKALEKVYLKIMEKFDFIWGFLYTSKIVNFISLPLRKPLARFKSKNLALLLQEYQPAIVISTQTVSTGIVAYLKSKELYHGRLVAVFSDFHTHPFWVYDEVDLYLCAIAEQVLDLKRLGVAKEKIAVTGMILADKFTESLSKEEARARAGLLNSMPVVLLFNGARPRMSVVDMYLRLLRSPKSFQIVVVCALNEELKKTLEKITPPSPHPAKILGYSNEVDVLMAASDVMIGKTGGPTMGETILKKLPMILTDINAGHEAMNLDYLVNNGIAQYARNPAEATFLVEQIIGGKIRKDWQKAQSKLIHPEAQVTVSDAIDMVKPDETVGLKVSHYQDNKDI